ncbi:DUF6879 family protein [Prauserella endophytica]|uniref:DUF6879 domain-containing protein n=1 Tax=Prauserella endophytica TaxID=1592324 RepID=A0ABY2RWR7_9PSEU|nr:DUF6879 family protein [Prauserella endophytica]TKG61571.1 hypothetical protein FCN18_33580 [Prauserella endophytica]
MDADDLARIAARAADRFRLEVAQLYLVPQEADDLAAWRRGDRTLPTPETSAWMAHLRDTTADGVRWSRVRIVDHPLTEYTEWELWGYQANAAAGEHIYIADRDWHRELADLPDFWLFDDTAVLMHYDEHGHFHHAEQAPDSRPYRGVRSVALRHSVPLADYLRRHEPRLIA